MWYRIYLTWDHFWREWDYDCWPHDVPGYPDPNEPPAMEELPKGFDIRDLTAHYYGAVTCVDDLLGRLMEALEHNGLEKETIVVFTSDHGDNLGSHHLFNKDCLYEESVRVPMLWRWPGKLAPTVDDRNIASLIDVMPTVLGLAGVDTPDHVQGRDLRPGGGDPAGENGAYIEANSFVHGRPTIGLRTPTHLYGAAEDEDGDVTDEGAMLFDMREDPMQETNLAGTGAQPEVEEELLARLRRWNRRMPRLQSTRS
jgi:arylsulfatase A-like enzyme